jgi:hypothetical protein
MASAKLLNSGPGTVRPLLCPADICGVDICGIDTCGIHTCGIDPPPPPCPAYIPPCIYCSCQMDCSPVR